MEKIQLTGKSKHGVDDTMKGLSAVLIDGDEIFIDNGAIHAKSRLERDLTFVKTREEIVHTREVLGLWITLRRFDGKQGFYGAMPFHLYIDAEAKRAYKSLSEQVNGMDKAVKGQVQVENLPVETIRRVGEFLRRLRPDLWENAGADFRSAFGT